MRFPVLLAFAALWSDSLAAPSQFLTAAGAGRSVSDIASDFERLMGSQPGPNATDGSSVPSSPSGTPKAAARSLEPFTLSGTPKAAASSLGLSASFGTPKAVASSLEPYEPFGTPKAAASSSEPSTPSGTPKTLGQLKYPLESPAAPANSKDAEVWKLLQAKQVKLKQVKQEILELIMKRNELLLKQNGSLKEQMDKVQAAILRAIDLNLAYKPQKL